MCLCLLGELARSMFSVYPDRRNLFEDKVCDQLANKLLVKMIDNYGVFFQSNELE